MVDGDNSVGGIDRLIDPVRDQRAGPHSKVKPQTFGTFEDFYRSRTRPTIAYLMVREQATFTEAEEATQAAMVDAYKNWATISSPEAWVRTAARNLFVNTRKRDRTGLAKAVAGGHLRQDDWIGDDPAVIDEQERHVLQVLGSLQDKQREVLAYTYDHFAPAEIAEITQSNPATVRSNLRAARHSAAKIVRAMTPAWRRVNDNTPGSEGKET